MELNSKHQKTLDPIFKDPIKSNIPWNDIESMLIALGAAGIKEAETDDDEI